MSQSPWSPFSEQFCLDSNSADTDVLLCFEENSESVWVKCLTSYLAIHAFQLCINQLRKLTPSPCILSPHTGHNLLQWLWLHLNWICRWEVHVICYWVICTATTFAEHGPSVRAMLSAGWISDTWGFYCLCIRVLLCSTQNKPQNTSKIKFNSFVEIYMSIGI